MKKEEEKILKLLRQNSRKQLTEISKDLDVAIATVFERLKRVNKNVIKNTTLFNFKEISYPITVVYALKIDDEKKDDLKYFLEHCSNVNNLFRSTNGYNFLLEAIFKDLSEEHNFSESIDSIGVKKKISHQIIQELKKEEFFT